MGWAVGGRQARGDASGGSALGHRHAGVVARAQPSILVVAGAGAGRGAILRARPARRRAAPAACGRQRQRTAMPAFAKVSTPIDQNMSGGTDPVLRWRPCPMPMSAPMMSRMTSLVPILA